MKIIRVTIQQPALPKYRIPFFKLLAEQENIDLSVYYSLNDPTLPNIEADGFKASYAPIYKFNILNRRTLLWHTPQWSAASRSTSDVLVLSWDLHYLSLLPAMLKAKINKVPVILWGHGYSKKENTLRKYLRQQVAKFASALVFYDYHTASTYINSGFCKNKIFVAPNSIDQSDIKYATSYWKNHKDELTIFQDQLNINPSNTIVYIGRIYSENRLDILIRALVLIKKEHSDVKLIVMGKGLNEEAHLRELSHSLSVSDHIIWVGALYEELEIAKWMLSATVFCFPEYIGLSIMHAFGYGLPVVTSDHVPGHGPEIYAFKDKTNGLFYRSGDSQSLASAIASIVNNHEQNNNLSNMAFRTVDDFNIPRMVSGFKNAILYAHKFNNNKGRINN